MIIKKETLFFIQVMGCLVFLFFGLPGWTQASSLNINIQESRIYIKAAQVPLINVLQTIAVRSGIFLETSDPLKEPVTIDLEDITVEDCVKRLLANRSYSLTFKKTLDGDFVLTDIRVLGQGPKITNEKSLHPVVASKVNTEPPGPSESPLKKYEKEWFKQAVENTEILVEDIEKETVEEVFRPDGTQDRAGVLAFKGSSFPEGMRVKEVPSESLLNKIGIKNGDLVRDVNGKPVETVEELVSALQNVPEDQAMIRIERINEKGVMDPIYIELH